MHYLYGKILHHLHYPDASGVKIPHDFYIWTLTSRKTFPDREVHSCS